MINWLDKKNEKDESVKDSTQYYGKKIADNIKNHYKALPANKKEISIEITKDKFNLERQKNKDKVGFDKNGFQIKEQNNIIKKGEELKAKYGKPKN